MSVDSPTRWIGRAKLNRRGPRETRFPSIPIAFLVLLILAGLSPGAHAAFVGFGGSAPDVSVVTYPYPWTITLPQATMPGSVLTPMLRLDIQHADVEEEDAGVVDNKTELVTVTVAFNNTRPKDIGAIAIAREAWQGLLNARAGTGPDAGLSPNNSDALRKRAGDWNVPGGDYALFTPDEDPIIAYVPMAQLLNDPEHPLDPYSTETFFVVFNLVPVPEVTPVYAYTQETVSLLTAKDRYKNDQLSQTTPATGVLSVSAGGIGAPNQGVFYVLVEPSTSLENHASIEATFPFQEVGPSFLWGPEEEIDMGLKVQIYNYANMLIIRSPEAAVVEQEEEVEGEDEPRVFFILADGYFDAPTFPRIHLFPDRPRLMGTDLITDQVPLRKINNIEIEVVGGAEVTLPNNAVRKTTRFQDNRVWTEFPVQAQPFGNKVWSQWPPGYPPLSTASRDVANASEYIIAPGRIHPDSGIVCGPMPSPEVLTAGVEYPWFSLDFGGGWPGGYSPRIDELLVEVQGLGAVRELPADGYDNDGDGLTDEFGAEDIPSDLQMPGRNDDFDFFVDLRDRSSNTGEERGNSTRLGSTPAGDPLSTTEVLEALANGDPVEVPAVGVSGALLSATEIILAASINQLHELGREPGEILQLGSGTFVPGQQQQALFRMKRGVMRGAYNKGWDPVFPVIHIMDEDRRETDFSRSPKYYRDVVTPGFDPERRGEGLTNAVQPQLRIKLEELPLPRRQYMASLLRIGAIQSRGIDEDGDGELNSPVEHGFKVADLIDNASDPTDPFSTGNGLIDEGIDEEADNLFDDDMDGLVDEDINFVPAYQAIDEEIHNFFVDGFSGTFGVPDKEFDAFYIDYNNNGIYEDGRDDHYSPGRDEMVSLPLGMANPLAHGTSYFNGLAFPIDDDLDAEGEDGNPLTPPPGLFDGIDNDGDGFADQGWNEDCREVVFGDPRSGIGTAGYITEGFLYRDTLLNSRYDAAPAASGAGDTPVVPFRPGVDNFLPPVEVLLLEDDPDRYLLRYVFGDPRADGDFFPSIPGPEIKNWVNGTNSYHLGFRLPSNMPPGLDFQVSMYQDSVKFAFDYRYNDITNNSGPEYSNDAQFFSLPEFNYRPALIDNLGGGPRYPATLQVAAPTAELKHPARSTAYQVTKRQFAHLEIADMMGYTSMLEKDSGFRGRPFLEANCKPTALLGINLADTAVAISEQQTKLTSIRVSFVNVDTGANGVFDPRVDLKPLSNTLFADPITGAEFTDSGVGLYLDNKEAGIRGEFDPEDTPIDLALDAAEWEALPTVNNGYAVTLRPAVESLEIPNTDYYEIPQAAINADDPNRGYDFFIVVRTSDQIDARDSFRAFIGPGDIEISNGVNVAGSFCMTHPYTANVPVSLEKTDFTGLPTNAVNQSLIPNSDSLPVVGINLHDSNNTFTGTPARLATVGVIVEDAVVTDATYFPRIGNQAGTPGPLDEAFGPCTSSGNSICATEEATFVHTINLRRALACNFYTVHMHLGAGSPYDITIVHQRGINRTTLMTFATDVPTGSGLTVFEDGDFGRAIEAIPGDQIHLEVHMVPESATLGACYLVNNCNEFPPGSGIEPPGYSWLRVRNLELKNDKEVGDWASAEPVSADGKFPTKGGIAADGKIPTASELTVEKDLFTTTALAPLTNQIITNIPLDPGEDNDGDSRTFPIPDGIDNDGDGLIDEGINNSFDFAPDRYTTLSGVAIFRDMPDSDTNGGFDDPLDPSVVKPDLPVFLSGKEAFGFPAGTAPYVTLALDHDPVVQVNELSPGKGDPVDPDPFETIPSNDLLLNAGNDYFIVIRTSRFLRENTTFQVRLGVLTGSVNPDFPGDNLAVYGVPFGFMPGASTGLGPVFPNRSPYGFEPLHNFRQVPSRNTAGGVVPVAEEPLSPGSIYLPGDSEETVLIETPFTEYESYKSIASTPLVAVESGNSPPSLTFIEPSFYDTYDIEDSLAIGSVLLKWNDLDQDDPLTTVTLVYFEVEDDPILGEVIPRTPIARKPNGDPFVFNQISGVFQRLSPGERLDSFQTVPYLNVLLINDNENVDPGTGYGNDIFTWDARLVPPGLYRVAAILDDGNNPRLLAVGGKVLISNERPIVTLTRPVGEDDGR